MGGDWSGGSSGTGRQSWQCRTLGLQLRGELMTRLEAEQLYNKVNNITNGDCDRLYYINDKINTINLISLKTFNYY